MSFLMSMACLAELAILIAVFFIICRRWDLGMAEAFSSAIILAYLFLSLVFQAAFLVHRPGLSFFFEVLFIGGGLVLLVSERKDLQEVGQDVARFLRAHPWLSGALITVWGYFLLQAIFLPEGNQDSLRYNLARVLLFQQEKSLFLTNVTEFHQAVFPVGGDIIRHLILRFYSDYGLAVFNLLTYLAVVFGVYGLSRRFASSSAALLASIICAGFPVLVYQATGTKPDILVAGVALFCVLAGVRLYEKPCFRDVVLLLLGLGFGLSVKTTFLSFAVPFFFGCMILLLYRHGRQPWLKLVSQHWAILVLLLLPIFLLSQVWLFGHNYLTWGGWFGPPEFVQYHRQANGLLGAAANSVRYFFQSIHLLTPVDLVAQKVLGAKISTMLQEVYYIYLDPLWGNAGTFSGIGKMPFELGGNRWGDGENGAWFGPLGFFLVLPALAITLFSGPRFLRLTAWTAIGYWSIICWQIAWMPWNGRFFSVFFVLGTPCLAYWLDKMELNKAVRTGLLVASCAIMVYAASFNQVKELFNAGFIMQSIKTGRLARGIISANIWARTRWGRDRMYWIRWYDGDSRVTEFAEFVPSGVSVGIASRGIIRLFPYLIRRPDLYFVPFYSRKIDQFESIGSSQERPLDYLLYIDASDDGISGEGVIVKKWGSSSGQPGRRTDTLVALH